MVFPNTVGQAGSRKPSQSKVKNFELISFASTDELARTVANAWLDEIESANRAGKTHCVALSGGRIAQKFFAATVEQAKTRAVSFAHVHFFWADERCVPPTDPESNFKLASELLSRRCKYHQARFTGFPAKILLKSPSKLPKRNLAASAGE